TCLGGLCLAEGEWEAASTYLGEASALADQTEDLQGQRVVRAVLAEQDILEGHPEAVFERLATVLDRQGQQERLVTLPLALLAWANLEVGQEAEAQILAAQSVLPPRVQRYRPVLVDVLRIEALIASRQGRRLAAQRAISEALALSRRMRYPYAEAKSLHVCGQLHLQSGESTLGCEQLEHALAIYVRL